MTNRTEEKGRPKDPTRSSYFSTFDILQDLGAKDCFEGNCVSEHFPVKRLFWAFRVKKFLTAAVRIKFLNRK